MKKLFKCAVCGLVYEGDSAPDKCPKCGVGPEKSELMTILIQNVYQHLSILKMKLVSSNKDVKPKLQDI